MHRTASLAVLIVGIVLIVFGLSAADSIGSDFTRLFAGKPTDKSIWLLVGGVAAAVIGAGGLLRSSKP